MFSIARFLSGTFFRDATKSALAADSQVLRAGASTLRGLCGGQSAHGKSVQEMDDPVAAEVKERLQELNDFLAGQPCGQQDALHQFAHFQSELTESTRALLAASADLCRETGLAQQAVEALLGAVEELRGDLERISALIGDAGADASGIVSTVKLPETTQAWTKLNAAVRELLAPKPLLCPLRPASLRKLASARRD